MRIGFTEVLLITILVIVLYFVFKSSIAKLLDRIKNPLHLILGLAGMIVGYFLGSYILLKLTFSSNQFRAIQDSSLNVYDKLRSDYTITGIVGGIVGSILFGVIGLLAAKILKNK